MKGTVFQENGIADKYLTSPERQNPANKLIDAKTVIWNPLKQLAKTEVVANY